MFVHVPSGFTLDARSNTKYSMPAFSQSSAVVNPAIPAPTIRTTGFSRTVLASGTEVLVLSVFGLEPAGCSSSRDMTRERKGWLVGRRWRGEMKMRERDDDEECKSDEDSKGQS